MLVTEGNEKFFCNALWSLWFSEKHDSSILHIWLLHVRWCWRGRDVCHGFTLLAWQKLASCKMKRQPKAAHVCSMAWNLIGQSNQVELQHCVSDNVIIVMKPQFLPPTSCLSLTSQQCYMTCLFHTICWKCHWWPILSSTHTPSLTPYPPLLMYFSLCRLVLMCPTSTPSICSPILLCLIL